MTSNLSNYEWYLKCDLSRYAGKWVAIIDKEIVGKSQDVEKLIKKVKATYPHKRPFVTKVRDKISIL